MAAAAPAKTTLQEWLDELPVDAANVLRQFNTEVLAEVLADTPKSELAEAVQMMLPPKFRRQLAECQSKPSECQSKPSECQSKPSECGYKVSERSAPYEKLTDPSTRAQGDSFRIKKWHGRIVREIHYTD